MSYGRRLSASDGSDSDDDMEIGANKEPVKKVTRLVPICYPIMLCYMSSIFSLRRALKKLKRYK